MFDTAYDTLQIILVASKCSERYRRTKKKKERKKEKETRESVYVIDVCKEIRKKKRKGKERKKENERERTLNRKDRLLVGMQIFGYQLKLQSRISASRKERRSTGGSLKLLNVCRRKTFLPVREKEFEEGSAVIADRPSLPPPFASLNTVVYLVGEIEMGKERTRQKEKKKERKRVDRYFYRKYLFIDWTADV